MFNDDDDKSYSMFDNEKLDKKIIYVLKRKLRMAENRIKELEDYIEKARLPEYMVLRPKQKDFNVTVLGQANGSPCSGLYVYNERTK